MRCTRLGAVVALACGSVAMGHGPQIQLSFDPASNKIQTRQIISTDGAPGSLSPLTRVFVMPMLASGSGASTEHFIRPDATANIITGLPVHVSNPGIAYQYESFVAGSGWSHTGSATLPNLSGTVFSLSFTDSLKQWNGTNWVDPGTEQLQMDRGGTLAVPAATAKTGDAAPFETLALTAVGAISANPHSTVRYRLLGDGTTSTSGGDAGIYLATLRINNDFGGGISSDPFHYVFYKNASLDSAELAAASLGFDPSLVQTYALVPEPATVGLLLFGVICTRRRMH